MNIPDNLTWNQPLITTCTLHVFVYNGKYDYINKTRYKWRPL